MFRRLVFEETAALCTIAAFITALSIYLTIGWRALRMNRPTIERFANLPFTTATPASVALRVSAGTKFAPPAGPASHEAGYTAAAHEADPAA